MSSEINRPSANTNCLFAPPNSDQVSQATTLQSSLMKATVVAQPRPNFSSSKNYSHYNEPISKSKNRLSGNGREWGNANYDVQCEVMKLILKHSSKLQIEDQAILLAIARLESGFNPDAAARQTSAGGVFQIVDRTARGLKLNTNRRFDALSNIKAGIKLFEQNLKIVNKRYPKLRGNERSILLYALHHDGPTLQYGGAEIARNNLLPYLDQFRELAVQYNSEMKSPKFRLRCH